jgi:hypothetical protein
MPTTLLFFLIWNSTATLGLKMESIITRLNPTAIELIRVLFENAGYTVPKIIFGTWVEILYTY